MDFYTAINCIDGRVQLPVINYLQKRFNVDYVDMITEPGPNRILASQSNFNIVESIFERLHVSVGKHHSLGVAVVGHHDCAGNPGTKEEQSAHTLGAVKYIKQRYSDINVIGLWVDENWNVSEIS